MQKHHKNGPAVGYLIRGVWCLLLAFAGTHAAYAAFDYRDTLERTIAPLEIQEPISGRSFDVFVEDQYFYDTNVYRLASDRDVALVVGPGASKQDHLNISSVGLDGRWSIGRQIIVLDLRGDENRYVRNRDLNNFSTNDKLVWGWTFGSALSGQLGVNYSRSLAGFVNTNAYTRNIVDQREYFGGARYQVGPRWALFGGIVDTRTTLSSSASQANNNQQKSGAAGMEFATSAANIFGAEYRYSKTNYLQASFLNNGGITPDYREDRVRAFWKYALSEKTLVGANFGYIKRDYPSRLVGAFAGNVWHVNGQWQPREKIQLIALGWRELQAYFTAYSDYYVSTGASFSPVWLATEKINMSALVSSERQQYLGNTTVISQIGNRIDIVSAVQGNLAYKPLQSLTANFTFRREKRRSSETSFTYVDTQVSAGVTFKF